MRSISPTLSNWELPAVILPIQHTRLDPCLYLLSCSSRSGPISRASPRGSTTATSTPTQTSLLSSGRPTNSPPASPSGTSTKANCSPSRTSMISPTSTPPKNSKSSSSLNNPWLYSLHPPANCPKYNPNKSSPSVLNQSNNSSRLAWLGMGNNKYASSAKILDDLDSQR